MLKAQKGTRNQVNLRGKPTYTFLRLLAIIGHTRTRKKIPVCGLRGRGLA